MAALPVDIPFDNAAEWLVQRKLVSSSYTKSLRTVHAKLAAALAEERPPVAAAATLVPAGAAREAVTYFDCVRLMAALKEAGMAEKNFLGQYTDAHASRWGEVVRKYESGGAFLADAAAFMVQQVGYELPALKAEAARAQRELSELQRRQGEYGRLAAGARDRFVAACEKKQLGADCNRDDIGSRLRESRAQLRGVYAQVASLCHGAPMVEAVRLYCDFVSHCLSVAARFGAAECAEGGDGEVEAVEAAPKGGKAKGGKGGKPKPGGGCVASAAVADAVEVAEASLPVLKLVQALDASPLLDEPGGGGGGGGGEAGGEGVDWGAEAGGEGAEVNWEITAGGGDEGDTEGGDAKVDCEADTGGGGAAEVDWGISASGGETASVEVDWGGGGAAEWEGLIEVEEADTGGGGASLFDVFEAGEKRNALLDDLHELDGFLAQRLEQVGAGGNQGLPDALQLDATEISSRLATVREVRFALESDHTRHLLLLSEPRYLERQERSLCQLLDASDKMAALASGLEARQAELRMELAASRPKYEAAVLRVQAVKSDFEAALSKQMDGRRINLMGAINAL